MLSGEHGHVSYGGVYDYGDLERWKAFSTGRRHKADDLFVANRSIFFELDAGQEERRARWSAGCGCHVVMRLSMYRQRREEKAWRS